MTARSPRLLIPQLGCVTIGLEQSDYGGKSVCSFADILKNTKIQTWSGNYHLINLLKIEVQEKTGKGVVNIDG